MCCFCRHVIVTGLLLALLYCSYIRISYSYNVCTRADAHREIGRQALTGIHILKTHPAEKVVCFLVLHVEQSPWDYNVHTFTDKVYFCTEINDVI